MSKWYEYDLKRPKREHIGRNFMETFRLKRFICWHDNHAEWNVTAKIKNDAFNWCMKRHPLKDDYLERIVSVSTKEQLDKELQSSIEFGIDPIVIFPIKEIPFFNEFIQCYADVYYLVFKNQPKVVLFYLNDIDDLEESWSCIFEDKTPNVQIECTHAELLHAIAVGFDRKIKSIFLSHKFYEMYKSKTFKSTDFFKSQNGWFIHKQSPLIRYSEQDGKYTCLGFDMNIPIN